MDVAELYEEDSLYHEYLDDIEDFEEHEKIGGQLLVRWLACTIGAGVAIAIVYAVLFSAVFILMK